MEWNVLNSASTTTKNSNEMSVEVLKEFDRLWESEFAKDYSFEFLEAYKEYLVKHPRQFVPDSKELFAFDETILPNRMQQEAITKLDKFRKAGQSKALAIAATGNGKTYMSVFDAMQFKPKKLLFVVHRNEILMKAKESFDKVIGSIDKEYSSAFFNADTKDTSAKYIFAMRNTLSLHVNDFKPDDFDYIVVDEAHHATSDSYKDILEYFKPKFLLGLTATPERSDSGDVFDVFDNNVAVEIRLRDALAYELICPFHYFGITDADGIDYSLIKKKPEDSGYIDEIAKMLMVSKRVNYIIEKIKFYDHDGNGKAKILGFCATNEHAQYMADEFNKRVCCSAIWQRF